MKKKTKKLRHNLSLVLFVIIFLILVIIRGSTKSNFPKFVNETLAITGSLNLNTGGSTFTSGGIWKSDGSVGIGTTNPGAKLHIYDTGNVQVAIGNPSGGDSSLVLNEDPDPNTYGFQLKYFGSADNRFSILSGSTSPSDRLTILRDSGNVGIGTTAPSGKFDIAGALGTASFDTNGVTLSFSRAGSNYINASNATGTLNLGAAGTGSIIQLYGGAAGAFQIRTTATAGNLVLKDGFVGIGTTSPGSKLDVSGTVNTSSTITAAGAIAANAGISQDGNVLLNGTDTWFRSTGATGWYNTYGGGWYMTDASWIKSYNSKPIYVTGNGTNSAVFMSGNVGIGTTAPDTSLHVSGAIYSATAKTNSMGFASMSGNNSIYNFMGTSGYWGVRTDTSNGINFDVYNGGSPLTSLTIKTNGNVGIGTTNPGDSLAWQVPAFQINGSRPTLNLSTTTTSGLATIRFKGPSTNSEMHWNFGDGTTPSLGLYSYSSATEIFTIKGDGKIGIGVSGPTYQFQVAGSVYASGSSKKFKQNIKDVEVDSTKIYDLRPVSFDYRPEYKSYGKELGSGRQIGLVAEEVFKTIPELSIKLGDQISNVDYEKLSVLLLSETQKQKKEIDSLTSKIKSLEQRLKLVESKLK